MNYRETKDLNQHFRKMYYIGSLIVLGLFFIFSCETHGKIKLPAEVILELDQPANPGEPLILIVSAISKVPFNSGQITMTLPPTDTEPSRDILLWSGSADNPLTQTIKHNISVLSVGTYQFRVTFEFTPQSNRAQVMRVSKKLYIDIQSDAIQSSNISFTHIKRLELKKELDRRGLSGLPAAQQKTLASDLIKQINELNKLETIPQPSKEIDLPEDRTPTINSAPLQGIEKEVQGSVVNKVQKKDYSKSKQAQEKRDAR